MLTWMTVLHFMIIFSLWTDAVDSIHLPKLFTGKNVKTLFFGVGTLYPGSSFAYCKAAMKDSTLWRVWIDFFYSWPEGFVIELPFLTIYFIEFSPPSFDEVQALCLTVTSLLRQNCLLQQQNEELTQANRALTDQVKRFSALIRRNTQFWYSLLDDSKRRSVHI